MRLINTTLWLVQCVLIWWIIPRNYMKWHLKNRKEQNLNSADLPESFNHCTLLIYYADQDNGIKSPMGIHSDCMYKTKDCTFDYARSGQEVNTPTVVLSLGDTRTLRWKRRHLFPKLHDSKVCRNNMVNIWHDDLS